MRRTPSDSEHSETRRFEARQFERKRKPKGTRKPRPLDLGSVCLGVVHVTRVTDKGLMVSGGDTAGDNWVPRSYVLDGENPGDIDRDSEVGDRGELWLPSWLTDKIPW